MSAATTSPSFKSSQYKLKSAVTALEAFQKNDPMNHGATTNPIGSPTEDASPSHNNLIQQALQYWQELNDSRKLEQIEDKDPQQTLYFLSQYLYILKCKGDYGSQEYMQILDKTRRIEMRINPNQQRSDKSTAGKCSAEALNSAPDRDLAGMEFFTPVIDETEVSRRPTVIYSRRKPNWRHQVEKIEQEHDERQRSSLETRQLPQHDYHGQNLNRKQRRALQRGETILPEDSKMLKRNARVACEPEWEDRRDPTLSCPILKNVRADRVTYASDSENETSANT